MVNGYSVVMLVIAAVLFGVGLGPVKDRFSGPFSLAQGLFLLAIAVALMVLGLSLMGAKPLGCP